MESKKRDIWIDREIREMLSIINEKHIIQLMKKKRNKNIFLDIAKEMKKKNFVKNDVQIRNKFKSLKSDFYKAKRRNNKSGAKRQTSEHFDLLDEIFGHHPALEAVGADTIEMDMVDEPESIQSSEEEEPTTSKSQGFERIKKNSHQKVMDTEMVDEPQSIPSNEELTCLAEEDPSFISSQDEEPTTSKSRGFKRIKRNSHQKVVETDMVDEPQSIPSNEELKCLAEEDPSFISSQDEEPTTSKSRGFKRIKKNSYQKVVETFTKEWKSSQAEMLQKIREQDEKLVDYQAKKQEEIMERNRKAMREMLEEDRRETSIMLQDFLNAMQPDQPYMFQAPQFFATEQSLASPVLLPKLSPRDNEDGS